MLSSSTSYMKPIVKDGLEGMFNNPEVRLNITDPHLTVTRQVIKLKEITQRVISATNGADSNEFDLEGSGEGSGGEGSGGCSEAGSGGSGCSGSGSGDKPTPWPQTVPTTGTDIINNNVGEGDDTTPFYPSVTTMGNEIVQYTDRDDQLNQANDATLKKSVGKKPAGGATLVVGTIFTSLFSFAVTGILLL